MGQRQSASPRWGVPCEQLRASSRGLQTRLEGQAEGHEGQAWEHPGRGLQGKKAARGQDGGAWEEDSPTLIWPLHALPGAAPIRIRLLFSS